MTSVLLLAGAAARADQAAQPFVIRNAGDYWNLSDAERQRPQSIRLDLLVYFYDPSWKLLWGENAGIGCYLQVRGKPFPIHAGQRVRFEGTVVPAAGIDGDTVKVTVLAENTLPTPIPTRGILADIAKLDAQWCVTEGYVCAQSEVDPQHIAFDVLSDGRIVHAQMLIGPTDPIPQLLKARIRFSYVYVATRDPTGVLRRLDGWIPSREHVTLLGWLDGDARFSLPAVGIERLDAELGSEWVHVAGEVRARDPDRSVTLRDASGQLLVPTEQPLSASPGDFIEVVGHPAGRRGQVGLENAVCRVVPKGEAPPSPRADAATPLLKLRLADEVMELQPEEAAQHYPTYLRGVVTWSDPKAGFFFLQDASGGLRIQCAARTEPPPPVGQEVGVLGVSAVGTYAPELELKELSDLGPSQPAAAHLVTLDEALTGSEEGQRVEIRGFLRDVEHAGIWQQLNLTTASGEFTAYISAAASVDAFVGSVVRVTGVCTAITNAQRQLTAVRLWVAAASDVQIELARAADPFSAPVRSIGSLRQFLAYRMLDRQVRLTGVVLYDRPGRFLYLQQDNAGLLVLHRDSVPVAPGDTIEVVGIPGRDGNRLVLREAVWRRTAAAHSPPPLVLAHPGAFEVANDGRLVRVRARLQDRIPFDAGTHLSLRDNSVAFEAVLDRVPPAGVPAAGSVVDLTGVYVLDYDEYRRPRGFSLQLRSADDLAVIVAAPWWTTSRALAIAGGFAACALLGIAGVLVLRRRVRQQTEQIRAQLEKEARLSAELERAARLESLGVLAGGIAHDFNNLLTVITANLGLAAMDERVREAAGEVIADAERGARRAADLTQQLLTFAKGGDPVRRAVILPEVVREAAEFARHGSRVRCDYEFQAGLPAADVDRGQISRVVHNLVLNAAQAMAEGGVIQVALAEANVAAGERPNLAPGRYVKLTVSDNGPGIAPEHLSRIFDPYFSTKPQNTGLGLATVHSIVKKHQGHVAVASNVGRGTTFTVWLPAAKGETGKGAPLPTAPCLAQRLRVLFMDDDEVIRRAAAGMLRQLGHDAEVVGDGAEAVARYDAAVRAGRRYDAVILDLTVPGGMGGREAIERLRQLDPDVRAIVSSGYSNDPVLANYAAYGFCAVVPKPYEVKDLARVIQEVAGARRPVSVTAIATAEARG